MRQMMRGHAGQHREQDHPDAAAEAKRGENRAGAIPRQSPAHAKHGGAGDKATVDLAAQPRKCAAEARRAAAGQAPGDQHRHERAAHDEGEGRVPGAEEVEESQDARGVGHVRDDQADTEYRTGDESDESTHGISLR